MGGPAGASENNPLRVPSDDELRQGWAIRGDELLARWIAERPGERPWAWWWVEHDIDPWERWPRGVQDPPPTLYAVDTASVVPDHAELAQFRWLVGTAT